MEIIGVDERDGSIFVKISKDDFANFAGFAGNYSMKEKIALKVGVIIDVGSCYNDALEVLEMHEKVLKAAQQLKASSTRFLSFFKIKEGK